MSLRNIAESVHICTFPKKVYRNNRLCIFGDSPGDLRWVDIEGLWFNVRKDDLCSYSCDGARGGKERLAGDNDFIAGPNICSHQGE